MRFANFFLWFPLVFLGFRGNAFSNSNAKSNAYGFENVGKRTGCGKANRDSESACLGSSPSGTASLKP